MNFLELTFTGLKMLPVLFGIGILTPFVTAPNGFFHISLLLLNEGKAQFENYRQPDRWRK
jgi:hypothetical protein